MSTMTLSFFTADGDGLQPTFLARSLWSKKQIHGVAVSGAMARRAEQAIAEVGRTDLRPVRWSVDLFRPADDVLTHVRSSVVRESARLCLIDLELVQDGETRARASALFVKPTEPAPGDVWEPADHPAPPPLDLAPVSDDPRVPIFGSAGTWTKDFADHQNAEQHMTWQTGVAIVEGESPTPFTTVASIADATSMVTNWGTKGVEQINTDVTLTLARQPVSLEVGLMSIDRTSADGIAVGTVVVFDRQGRLGAAMTTSMANVQRSIDFTEHNFSDDPRGA